MIGSFGSITFEVSDSKILTFKDFKQEVAGRWAKHERIMGKAKSEFLGADLRTITFSIRLDAHFGVRPRTNLELLQRMVEKGVSDILVIGSKPVSDHPFKILKVSEAWDIIMNRGELAKATVDLTLEELVDE